MRWKKRELRTVLFRKDYTEEIVMQETCNGKGEI